MIRGWARSFFMVSLVGGVLRADPRPVAPSANVGHEHWACGTVEGDGAEGAYNLQTWPSGVVPYTFAANVTSANRQAFLSALPTLAATCNVTFVPRNPAIHPNWINIINSTTPNFNYSSSTGMAGGQQTIGMWNWTSQTTVWHEMMHALGFYHEQSRPDRDLYVSIEWPNINPQYAGNFNLHPNAIANGPYDFASVMHYDDISFSINGRRTIEVLAPNQVEWQWFIGAATELSNGDIWALTELYGGTRPPRVFELTAPATGSLVGQGWSPTFSWQAAELADEYHLIVDDSPQLASPEIEVTLTTASYTNPQPLAPDTLYYWTVVASNSVGETGPFPFARSSVFTGGPLSPVLYVDHDAPAGGLGSSWNDAIDDLYRAAELAYELRATSPVQEIHVAGGTYKVDGGSGNRARYLRLPGGLALLGGYAGTGAAEPDERDPAVYVTTLNGDLAGDDLPGFQNRTDNSYWALNAVFATEAVRIDGFVVERFYSDAPGQVGALTADECALRLSNCTVQDNWASFVGAAGYLYDSPGTLIDRCTFVGNFAVGETITAGGALLLEVADDVLVANCRFEGNQAFAGGAVYTEDDGSLQLVNCVFVDNHAPNLGIAGVGGAVVTARTATPAITNCTFWNNSATGGGGAVAVAGDSQLSITNSILYGDTAPAGSEIHLDNVLIPGAPSVTVGSSNVAGGQTGISMTGGSIIWGAGNIDADPLYVGSGAGDFGLASGSPCIDAGDNAAVPADAFDLDGDGETAEPVPMDAAGHVRFADDPAMLDTGSGTAPIIDLGAYEVQRPGDLNGDGLVDLSDHALFYLCLNGPDVLVSPMGCTAEQFASSDLSGDGDADLADAAAFQNAFTGP